MAFFYALTQPLTPNKGKISGQLNRVPEKRSADPPNCRPAGQGFGENPLCRR